MASIARAATDVGGGVGDKSSGRPRAASTAEDAELLLAFAATPSPNISPTGAATLTPAFFNAPRATQGPSSESSAAQVSSVTNARSPLPTAAAGRTKKFGGAGLPNSISPATAHAPSKQKLAKLRVRVPLCSARPRARLGSPFKRTSGAVASFSAHHKKTVMDAGFSSCGASLSPTSAFASPQRPHNAGTKHLRLSIPGQQTRYTSRSSDGNGIGSSRKRVPSRTRVSEMLIAAAAMRSRGSDNASAATAANNDLSQRQDSDSPWDSDVAALATKHDPYSCFSSTTAEEKGSPRFVAGKGFGQSKRKRSLSFDVRVAPRASSNVAACGAEISHGSIHKGMHKKSCAKRARFADPVVSGHLSPDRHYSCSSHSYSSPRAEEGAQEAKESQPRTTSTRPAATTLQGQLNQSVPRGRVLMPHHPAPLSSETVSEEPLLRQHLQNLFALFWDTLFPLLERHGWSYACATAVSFECFAVPGATSSARPSALLRSVFEVIQFVQANGITGDRPPSSSSSSSSSEKMCSGSFEKECDERAACDVVKVLLDQRRTIAAMRYNLLRRQMQQQQECILQHQRLILQAQLKGGKDSNKKSFVPEIRPAPTHTIGQLHDGGQGSMYGLSMPLFSAFEERLPVKQLAKPKPMAKKRAAKKNAVKRQKKVKVLSRKKVSKKAIQPVGAKKNMPKRSMFL